MKAFVLLASLTAFTPTIALADYFQFFECSRPYYIPYAQVTLDGKTLGYTDAYGRLDIDLPPGEYEVQIHRRAGLKTARLVIDDGSTLKKVEASCD